MLLLTNKSLTKIIFTILVYNTNTLNSNVAVETMQAAGKDLHERRGQSWKHNTKERLQNIDTAPREDLVFAHTFLERTLKDAHPSPRVRATIAPPGHTILPEPRGKLPDEPPQSRACVFATGFYVFACAKDWAIVQEALPDGPY